uniref:Reverse transcriptase domain-containing protein n=1 Tax=Oryzias melastigma TaxID=30732 RepID=A0A3B3C1K9_ORYME
MGVPAFLRRTAVFRRSVRRRRRRGKRSGRIVRLRACCPSSWADVSRACTPGSGLFAPWRLFSRPKPCLIPVVGGNLEADSPVRAARFRVCWRKSDSSNLVEVPRVTRSAAESSPETADPPSTPRRFGLINARSVMNKTFILKDFFDAQQLDFLGIVESWIPPAQTGVLLELLPENCLCFNVPRSVGRGGGLLCVFKSYFNLRHLTPPLLFNSFEFCLFDSGSFLGILLYRPPKFNATFLTDFSELLYTFMPKYEHVLILGDFNIHVCCPDKPLVKDFFNVLDSFNLVQWVSDPTHAHGHTLDLALSFGFPLTSVETVETVFSDHSAVLFNFVLPLMTVPKPAPVRWVRGLDEGKAAEFSALFSLEWPTLYSAPITTDSFLSQFDLLCSKILDEIAPLTIRKPRHTSERWISEEIRALRRDCRKAERKFKKDRLQISQDLLRDKLYMYNEAVMKARRQFYSNIISSASGDQRILFNTLGSLLDSGGSGNSMEGSVENCEKFCVFFMDKVAGIRSSLTQCSTYSPPTPSTPVAKLESFSLVSLIELERVVSRLKPAGSSHDVLPAWFFKKIFSVLGPAVLTILNTSLESTHVPKSFKQAVVRPLLKKQGLDTALFSNYRPISHLPFCAKVLENIVYKQLITFLNAHEVLEPLQSGFRSGHSTETALLKIFNDVLIATDAGNLVVLLLLDLSAAFDTVDHEILIGRLEQWAGLSGEALQWMRSYLTDRSFCVKMGSHSSKCYPLKWGVPQGSVLGPLLFSIYLLPLGVLFRKHKVEFHLYADDCQIYVPICKGPDRSIKAIIDCLAEVKLWMSENFLGLNENKTEVIVFSPSGGKDHNIDLLSLAPFEQSVVTSLGVKLDAALKLDLQINAVTRSCFFQMRRLARIKSFISKKNLEIVTHAFVLSRLYYCSSLYAGLPKASVARLQLVQNAAARFICGAKKFDHITPILASLNWLPVQYLIFIKILVFTFKSLAGTAPPYLSSLVLKYSPTKSLRSADQCTLLVPRTKRKFRGDRAFSVLAPKLWNQLPPAIREITLLECFKKELFLHYSLLALA